MELTVQEKIQLALQPLLDRIALLQADNLKFKQEIAQLQSALQPKPAHKPNVKPPQETTTRPQSGKASHKVPPQNDKKKPVAKEQAKEEHEQNKLDEGKHPISTPTAPVTGQHPPLHKQPVAHQDGKNSKELKHARPNLALAGGKTKPADTNNPAPLQKNGHKQKEDKKDANLGEAETKVASNNNNVKKPPPPQKKLIGTIHTPKAGATGAKKTQKGLLGDLKKKGAAQVKAETSKKQQEAQAPQESKPEEPQTILQQKKQQTPQKEEVADVQEKHPVPETTDVAVEGAQTLQNHVQPPSQQVASQQTPATQPAPTNQLTQIQPVQN